jgi:uncharacterized protein YuzE
MDLHYYPETDMLYIGLAEGASVESEEVAPGVVLDLDVNRCVLGIEIEDASKSIDLSRLEVTAVPVADLLLQRKAPVKA